MKLNLFFFVGKYDCKDCRISQQQIHHHNGTNSLFVVSNAGKWRKVGIKCY